MGQNQLRPIGVEGRSGNFQVWISQLARSAPETSTRSFTRQVSREAGTVVNAIKCQELNIGTPSLLLRIPLPSPTLQAHAHAHLHSFYSHSFSIKMRSYVVAAYVVAILSAGLPAFGTPVPLAAAVGKIPPSIHPHITVCTPAS